MTDRDERDGRAALMGVLYGCPVGVALWCLVVFAARVALGW